MPVVPMLTVSVVEPAVAGLGAKAAVTPVPVIVPGRSSSNVRGSVNVVVPTSRSMVTVTVCVPPSGSISAVGATLNENSVDCTPVPPVPFVPPVPDVPPVPVAPLPPVPVLPDHCYPRIRWLRPSARQIPRR